MAITAVTASATMVASTSSTSTTITSPTGTTTGDVLVCVVGEKSSTEAVTSIAASGGGSPFINLNFRSGGASSGVSVWYRVVQAGDPTTWTVTKTVVAEIALMAYRGTDTANPISQGSTNSGTASPGTFNTATTIRSGDWYVGAMSLQNASSVLSTLSSGSPTPTIRGNAGNGGTNTTKQACALIDVAETIVGATGTFVYTLTSGSQWGSFSLILRSPTNVVYPLGYYPAGQAGADAVYRM